MNVSGNIKYKAVYKTTEKQAGSSSKLLDVKAKSTYTIGVRIKQLHVFVIKHRVMCGVV